MKKTKAEQKKPIHKIQLGRVHYLYQVGICWIAIETDPKTNWAEMPEYMRVCFGIETPISEWAELKKPEWFTRGYAFAEAEAAEAKAKAYDKAIAIIDAFVIKAIKKKTNEQRKAYAGTVGANSRMGKCNNKSSAAKEPSGMPDAKRRRRKPVDPMLPFESDSFTDDRKTAV